MNSVRLGAFILLLIFNGLGVAEGAAWTFRSDIPIAQSQLIAGGVNGRIYAGEGVQGALRGEFQEYDPGLDSWIARTSAPGAIYGRGGAVTSGKILAVGGIEFGGPLKTVDLYDPTTDTWSRLADLPTQRTGLAAVVVDGKVYALGGSFLSGSHAGSTANEVYDPATDSWSVRSPMPIPRQVPSAAVIDGEIYVFGGVQFFGTASPTFLDQVDVYSPVTDSWTSLPLPMPRPRAGASAVTLDGKILLIGGLIPGNQVTDTVDEFDPATGTWTPREPMNVPRFSFAATDVDGLIYVIGGENLSPGPTAPYLSSVEVYDPKLDVTRPRDDEDDSDDSDSSNDSDSSEDSDSG